jgi:hypothetical protein
LEPNEALAPVAIRSSDFSDDGDDWIIDKEHRYSPSVWLEHMEDEIDDVPELPPLHVPPSGSRAGTILIT